MVSSKIVCSREKSSGEKSPSPEPFREPEGMMSIDLNDENEQEDSINIKNTKGGKRNRCLKFFLYLAAIKLIILLSFLLAFFINSEYYLFTTVSQKSLVNNLTNIHNLHKFEKIQKTTNTPNFKQKLLSTNYIEDKKSQLSQCKISKTLEDCCKIFLDTELFGILELCTVKDIIEIILNHEENEDRIKRQINFEPPYALPPPENIVPYAPEFLRPDPKMLAYLGQIPYKIKSKIPVIYGAVNNFLSPPPPIARANMDYNERPNFSPFESEDFDYPEIKQEPQNLETDNQGGEYFDRIENENFNPRESERNNYKDYGAVENLPQIPPERFQNQNHNPIFYIAPKNQQVLPTEEVNEGQNLVYIRPVFNDKNKNRANINFNLNLEVPRPFTANLQPRMYPEFRKETISPYIGNFSKPTKILAKTTSPATKISPTTDKTVLEEITKKPNHLDQIINPNTPLKKICQGKNCSKVINTDSKIEEIVDIKGTNKTIEIDLKNTTINLSKTSQPQKAPKQLDPIVIVASELEETTTFQDFLINNNFTENETKQLDIKESVNERANQQEQEFRPKIKVESFPTTNEDVQSNQQSLVNPCFYSMPTPFGAPYKIQPQYDNNQLLKIVPIINQPKLQQSMYVLNPPMYSYIPPQAPYIQSYASPMQPHYNPFNNPIQVSGPGGQYYTCNPIPSPSNNIASLPGVEVRSSNLQDMMEFETPETKTNSTTREAINCPRGETSCQDGSKCIKNNQVCDNEVQCEDASDEMFCSCSDRVGKIRQCDGFFDCPNGEDERGCFGCNENEFSCDDWSRFRKSTCIPMDQRCDNIRQCEVTGKDEEDCSVLVDHIGKLTQFKVSNAVGFLHRNYKGKWYPTCFGTEIWAMDVCKTETGPSNVNPRSHMMVTNTAYEGLFINILPNNEVSLVNSCVQDRAAFVECPPLYCGLRMMVKNPYRQQEVDTSAEDILSNLERSNIDEEIVIEDLKTSTEVLGVSRVVGGRPSQPAAWPWLVSMYKNGIFHCGGVLINELWVVTAAHCIDKYWQYYYEIQAGMLRRFSYSPMVQNRWVVEAIAHENYNKNNLKNDIALLRLSSSVRYNRYVRPICLPSETTAGRDFLKGPEAGTICTTVGWGATIEHGTDPDNMREVEIPVLSNCKHVEDQEGEDICAGLDDGGKDACQGDSGGPFMCRNPNNPSQWYLAGVVSHGEGCARPNEPGVYTRVSKYVGWIAENIRDDKFVPRIPLQACPGYTCKGTNRCLSKKRRCDKVVDCLMGDDETDCEVFHDLFKNSMKSRFLGSSRTAEPKANFVTGLLEDLFPKTIFEDEENDNNVTTTFSDVTVTEAGMELGSLTTENDVETSTESNAKSTDNKNKTFNQYDDEIFFKCSQMLQIIAKSKRCNKIIDCEDGTDELDCGCIDYVKNHNPRAVCDGITDCSDFSDEMDCVKCNYSSEYSCRTSQKCIDISKRCDGVGDCDKNEDEWDCAALTNGATLTLDSDLRPKLGMSGIITINRLGVWRPLCTNMSDNEASIATNVCNLLGFEEYTGFHKYPVKDKPLNVIIDGFKQPDYTDEPKENQFMCTGLYVRCSNVSLDSSVHRVYQDNITNDVELYTSPWNAVIYSDGIYKCMGTILDTQWIVTSINCFKGITILQLHYVVILLGKGKSQLFVQGPHEQTIRVAETIQIENTDVILLRLEKNIVYTRYIRPTHLNARRDGFRQEKCVAIGLEDNTSKYVSLKPIKNCPDGLRCFESKIRKNCLSSLPWSGTIVCDSRNGWYPAAVYYEENGSCGLSNIKQYTSIKFLKNKILKAMKHAPMLVEPSQCDGFRCNLGECISKNQTCDGIPQCRSGEDEEPSLCYEKEVTCHLTDNCGNVTQVLNHPVCPITHMKCKNQKCIPKSSFCDRKNDCGDFEDEPDVCSCVAYLKLSNPSKICDGVVNCMDRSDEDPKYCHQCGLKDFKCENTEKCISNEMVCDGFTDCPNGNDEKTCLTLKPDDNQRPYAGEVLTRTAGIWHSGCFKKNYTTVEVEEICFQLGFTSGSAYQVTTHRDVSNFTALHPAIDQFNVVWIHRSAGNRLKLRMRTGNEPYITFYPDQDCHRLYLECI